MTQPEPGPLRIGVLGCASVVDYALVAPSRVDEAVAVVAVASRSASKAETFAAQRGIPHSHGSYHDLLADREIDAVYVALPNSMHHQWSIAALEAGFPVLCEKPLATSAAEASVMAAVAAKSRLPLVEAAHWRRHPLAGRLVEAVRAIGEIRQLQVDFHVPAAFLAAGNIRLDSELGGGSLLDQGCYCVDLVRLVGGGRPVVVRAAAEMSGPDLDGAMEAVLRLPGGGEATMCCSMNRNIEQIECRATITGERGVIEVANPFLPGSHPFLFGAQATLLVDGVEHPVPTTSSYVYQARHFANLVRAGRPDPAISGSIDTLAVVDDIFRAAEMRPRSRSDTR